MAYRAATLFPFTEAGEGLTNAKVRDTSGAAHDANTVANFGTNTTVRFFLAYPSVFNNTSATPTAGQDKGWNVLKADMNDTANPPNKRYIAAGTWTFKGSLTAATSDAASASYLVRVFVHRRSASGVLTQIGASTDSVAAAIVTTLDWTATLSLPEILLATDETLHFEYWVQGRGGGATGLLAQSITFNVGTTTLFNELTIALPTSGITTRFYRSITAILVGVAAAIRRKVKLPRAASPGMVGTAAAIRRKVKLPRTATMTGLATVSRRFIARRAFANTMTGVAGVVRRKVGLRRSAVMVGIAQVRRKIGLRRSATMVGVAAFARRLTLHRAFANTAVGVATLARRLTLRRALSATMVGVVSAFLKLPFAKVPSSGGGGNTYSRGRVTNT